MCKIITNLNHKGGTGKTDVLFHLSTFLAKHGGKKIDKELRILLIDNDPQANLSEMFLDDVDELEKEETLFSVYNSFANQIPFDYDKVIHKTKIANIDLIPNTFETTDLEMVLIGALTKNIMNPFGFSPFMCLNNFIEGIKTRYDFIFIDNHASLGVFTRNAILASSDYFVVVTPSRASVRGLNTILKGMDDVNKSYEEQGKNTKNFLGAIINLRNDQRKKHSEIRAELFKQYFESLFICEIHSSAVLEKHSLNGLPISDCRDRAKERSYKEYRDLTYEFLRKLGYDVELNIEKLLQDKVKYLEKKLNVSE